MKKPVNSDQLAPEENPRYKFFKDAAGKKKIKIKWAVKKRRRKSR